MAYDGSPSKFAKQIKEVHDSIVTDETKADLEITTTHQYKGRERDVVVLSTDFTKTVVSFAEAMERNKPASEGPKLYRKLTDETNLVYVAMTRAKRVLILNPQLDALLHYVHPPTFVPRRLTAVADGGGKGGKERASEAEGGRWNESGSGSASEETARVGDWFGVQVATVAEGAEEANPPPPQQQHGQNEDGGAATCHDWHDTRLALVSWQQGTNHR